MEELKQLTTLLPHLVQNFEVAEKKKKVHAEMDARAAELKSENDGGAFPSLRRTDSDGFSDMTLPVNNNMAGTRESMKDIDCESIYSVRSVGPR
jgi:hypothetical protein